MKINIKDQEIELKYSFRSLIIFEEITGKTMTTPDTLKDILILFYSVVLSSAKGSLQDFTWDNFMDYLDENPDLTVEFVEWLKSVLETQNGIAEKHSKEVEKKTRRKSSTQKKNV